MALQLPVSEAAAADTVLYTDATDGLGDRLTAKDGAAGKRARSSLE